MPEAGSKLRTIIVDDEPLARKLLRSLLADIPEIEVVAECGNGREAIKSTRELQPDLLVLDIQMPGLSGFDVIKELQADSMPMVIFCTAYQRYALDAFDLHAVDYLLKPIDSSRLERAVARALDRLDSGSEGHDQKAPLLGAIDDIARKAASTDRAAASTAAVEADEAGKKLAIKDRDSTVVVDFKDIDWVDAAGDYMCVHVKGESYIMRSTLKGLMSKLEDPRFRRIHRSTIVNLDRIVKVTSLQKGEYILDLDCDVQLKVSRNYRDAIKNYLTRI